MPELGATTKLLKALSATGFAASDKEEEEKEEEEEEDEDEEEDEGVPTGTTLLSIALP